MLLVSLFSGQMSQPPLPEQPLSPNALFSKVTSLTRVKVNTISAAYSALVKQMQKDSKNIHKISNIASGLFAIDPMESIDWVNEAISTLTEALVSDEWFKESRSPLFYMAFNLSIGTDQEMKLRVIADTACSSYRGTSLAEVIELLKISSVVLSTCSDERNIYPSGPIALISHLLTQPQTRQDAEIMKHVENLIKCVSKIHSASYVIPQILSGLDSSVVSESIKEIASIIEERRIQEFLTKRVFPKMIVQIEPRLEERPKKYSGSAENGELTSAEEERKLKKQLKKQRSVARREARLIGEKRRQEKVEEIRKKREEREKSGKEMRRLMETERTYDLNMAAQPAAEETEENKADKSGEGSSDSEYESETE